MKYHLAGVEAVDPRPFLPTLRDAYRNLTLSQIVEHKTANLKTVVAQGPIYWAGVTTLLEGVLTKKPASVLGPLAEFLRSRMFFYLFPSVGLPVAGLFALAAGFCRRFRSSEWRAASLFWLIVAFSVVGWCTLMFGPGTTVNHTGAYAVVLLAMSGGILSLWAISRRFTMAIVLAQICLNILLYGPLMHVGYSGAALPEGRARPVTVALTVISFLLLVFLFRDLASKQGAKLDTPDETPLPAAFAAKDAAR